MLYMLVFLLLVFQFASEKLIPSGKSLLKEIIDSVLLFACAAGLGRDGMSEVGE